MVAPLPGAWTFGATLTTTALHIQHIERDDPGQVVPYWHDQHLRIGETDLSVARGLWPGVGIGLTLPLRVVRDRIRFEDLARQPYVPPNPDTHHRNETLTHVADAQLVALFTRRSAAWTLGAGLGTSIPLGRTEPNPFALGRLGLPHQHIQFGTGSWDPSVSLLAARPLGSFGVSATASANWAFASNAHGYEPGDRFNVAAGANHPIGAAWRATAGLSLAREEAERWSGHTEEEGNLGRTDLSVQTGLTRTFASWGTYGATLQLPIRTWSTGEQVRFPFVISVSWIR